MRKVFFILVIMLLGEYSFSQQYLNKTFNIPNNAMHTILPTDSGYILGLHGGMGICLIDLQANIKWIKTYYDPTGTWASYTGGANPNALNSTNHNTFIAGGTMQNGGPTANKVFSVKYSSTFDTLFLKLLLQDTVTTNNYVNNSFVNNSGNYVFVGHSGNSALIIQTDTNSNFIDSSLILKGNEVSWFNAGLQMGNSYYLFGGTYCYAPVQITGFDRLDGWVVKTNLQGNELISAAFGNSLLQDGEINNCKIINGNKLAFVSNKSLEKLAISAWIKMVFKTGLTILNDDLTINKEIYFKPSEFIGDSMFFIDVTNLLLNNDSSFILFGTQGSININSTIGNKNGFAVKVNKKLQIKYFRKYLYLQSGIPQSLNVYLHCGSITNDNGYILGGMVSDLNLSSDKSWLIKTDSLGCDGFHSCDDTTLVCQILNAPDTVCKNDTSWLQVKFKGRSAPYFIYANNTLALDSVYYPYTLPLWIDTLVPYYPITTGLQQVIIKVNDPWGWNRTDTVQIFVKNCGAGNIEEAWYPKKVEIYPNPATNELHVKIRSVIATPVSITIYDMQGKVVKQITTKLNETVIDVSELESGVYGIRIYGNGLNCNERFVKL
ncbi:MAG: T9SS type A sorting domain-containing protein [Bacteroidia bacterium]|nr:T9SS type A sorting domain-containing protein [Bacteroidia bacterium]